MRRVRWGGGAAHATRAGGTRLGFLPRGHSLLSHAVRESGGLRSFGGSIGRTKVAEL